MSARAPRCRACLHPERFRIELALASGVALRPLGRKYGMHRMTLHTHWTRHVPEERKAQLIAGPVKLRELADKAAEEGCSLLDYLAMVRSGLLSQFFAATEAGDRNGAAIVAGRLLECLRIMAQLSGELMRPGAQIVNNVAILASPLMADLQAMLVRTLAPYPDARAAVLAGLEELSRRAVPDSGPSVPALAGPVTVEASNV